jgi:competence protein ComEC
MATLALLAGYLGRPADGLRVLALAVIALLAADPFLLRSVGFLLSCGASAGIVLLAPRIAVRLPGPRWAADIVAVTAAAQIGVAPVLLPVFGSIPVVALPANLVAVPLAGPLTVWGLLAGIVGGLARARTPVVASVMSRPTTGLLHAIVAVAEIAARVPLAVDGRAVWGITALLSAFVAARRFVRWRSGAALGRPAGTP